jgi:hypothetical protein
MCNLSMCEFGNQVDIFESEAIKLFKSNYDGTIDSVRKSHLHRKINLCNVGLGSDWHSPVFATKVNNNIILTTGHNKVYATMLRKKNFNMDFNVFLLDMDRDDELDNRFINVKKVNDDYTFKNYVGSNDFAIDISFEMGFVHGGIPAVMQFSNHYPIEYHDGTFESSTSNELLYNSISNNDGKIDVYINDSYASLIYDTSGLFNQIRDNSYIPNEICTLVDEDEHHLNFKTQHRISFDLSNLLPFFDIKYNIYIGNDNSYIAYISRSFHNTKKSCPSEK